MYQEEYQKTYGKYQDMVSKYMEKCTSPEYFETVYSNQYGMLSAVHLVEKLKLYKDMKEESGKLPKMNFHSVEEAEVLMKNLMYIRKNEQSLLDGASTIYETMKLGEEINRLVDASPYLTSAMKINLQVSAKEIADRTLEVLPQLKPLMTADFRIGFLENCINQFSENDLDKLAADKILIPGDMEKIHYSNVNAERLSYLCKKFGVSLPGDITYDLRLKGATFDNADGVNRQTLLKELDQYMKAHAGEQIGLTARQYEYQPVDKPAEPAIGVYWGDKQLGNISKELVADIMEHYTDPTFRVKLKSVLGGGDVNYGLNVEFTVTGLRKEKEAEIER